MTNYNQRKLQTEKCMKDLVDTRDLLNNNGFNINKLINYNLMKEILGESYIKGLVFSIYGERGP